VGNHPRWKSFAVQPMSPEFSKMLELAAIIVVSATTLSFLTDATSDTFKMVRAMRRRSKIRTAAQH
jgi:hypothetical protein